MCSHHFFVGHHRSITSLNIRLLRLVCNLSISIYSSIGLPMGCTDFPTYLRPSGLILSWYACGETWYYRAGRNYPDKSYDLSSLFREHLCPELVIVSDNTLNTQGFSLGRDGFRSCFKLVVDDTCCTCPIPLTSFSNPDLEIIPSST
jgi:hypothetical protein